jgi:8-oxo-dGTP pyrophosphatase MutT (NUDIX family)
MFHVIQVRWPSKREVFGRFLELHHAGNPSDSESPTSYPEIDDYNWGALLKAAA